MPVRSIEVPCFIKSARIKQVVVEVEIAIGKPEGFERIEKKIDVDIDLFNS